MVPAVGVSVCEDAWDPTGPISAQAAAGAELMVNINASPYYARRLGERQRMLATRAADASCALVYVNIVGGQDELVFDGASMVFDAEGRSHRGYAAVRRGGVDFRHRGAAHVPQKAARPERKAPRPGAARGGREHDPPPAGLGSSSEAP